MLNMLQFRRLVENTPVRILIVSLQIMEARMKKIGSILVIFLFALCSVSYAAEKEKINYEAIFYSGFKTVKTFGSLSVSLQGTAEKIGIKENELTDYLKLRFKNSFAKYEYKEVEKLLDPMRDKKIDPTIGFIHITVWTVGEDYPVAYHISINSGNLNNVREYTNAQLGYGSKSNIPDTVKESISSFIDELAIAFFKARGEF